ncbi:MAG: outer membrane protein [Planctomycetota bacterium]|jgi:opacity protein-like surface antigen
MGTIWVGILCAAMAAADPVEPVREKPAGLYLTLSGMVVLQEDSDLTSVGGIALDASLEYDPGFGVQGGVGYTFSWESPVSLSLELDYAFRSADVDTLEAPGLSIPAGGTNDSHAIMFNALASVEVADGFGFYGGGGIGVTITEADLSLDLGGGVTLRLPSDTDVTFSWQVMGGAQYALGRHVVFFGGVKYFDAGDVSFDTFGGENRSLAFEAGLRVYF